MSSVTGTGDAGPATPLVVPPRGAVGGDPTGTTAAAPATPLVVPGLTVAARVVAPPAAPAPVRTTPRPVRHVTVRKPRGSLAATGGSALLEAAGTLLLVGGLWLRRRVPR